MLVQQNFLTPKAQAYVAAACGITIICGTLVIIGTWFYHHPLAPLIAACAVGVNVAAELVFASIHQGDRRRFFLIMAMLTAPWGFGLLDTYFGSPVFNYLVESVHLGALTGSVSGASAGLRVL
jgi:hypothetical protein